MLQAQRTITGTVVSSEDNQGLPGVQVVAKGMPAVGITTDISGRYSLNVPSEVTHLVFTFMGMATQEIEIGGQTSIDVVMKSDAQQLEGVVVTALGINRSEKSVGFATSNVGSDELVQKSEPDALRALEGKVPGVGISGTSGAAGSSTRITIRGNSSFFGDNQPLFVVDGIPYSNQTLGSGSTQLTSSGGAYGNSFSTLDPNDIESMQVLKGAAAAALYGSRAANGVILITTKSGSKTRRPSQKGTEVTLATSWAWETISSLPDYQNKYGAGANFNNSGSSNGSFGSRLDVGDSINASQWAPINNAYPELFPTGKIPYIAHPNNVKDLFRTGFMQDYSFNVSSQNDKGVFNLTASRMHQESYIPNTHFTRTSVSVGGNNTLDNKFKISGNVAFSNTDQLGSTYGSNSYAGGTSSFARTMLMARNWDISLPYADQQDRPIDWVGGGQFDHPMWAVRHNTVNTKMNRVVAQAGIGYDITSWLNVRYQLGSNINFSNRTSIIDVGSRVGGGTGQTTFERIQNGEIESNLMLTLTKMLTKDISLQAIVGQNLNQRQYSDVSTGGANFTVPGVYTADNMQDPWAYSYTYKRRLAAVFADVALGYKNYLFLNLTGRNDWSSTLPTKNNSYFYPALNGSFVLTDAVPSIKNDYLSNVRLRAGWAKVGNDAGVYYDYLGTNLGIETPFYGLPRMFLPASVYDENLRPEFTHEMELGGILGLFKDRMSIDFTWYNRRTTDQIAPLATPYTTGKSSLYTNFGEVQNKGVELLVEGQVIKTKNFEWNLLWNFTKNKNTVISTYADSDEPVTFGTGGGGQVTLVLEPGMPYGYFRGTRVRRDNEGNLLINPINGQLHTHPVDTFLGSPHPDFVTSVASTFTAFGFSLSFMFDFQKGGDVYSEPVSDIIGRGVSMYNVDREGGFVIPGYYSDAEGNLYLDAEGDKIANVTPLQQSNLWFGNTFAVNSANEFKVFDATVFRLREISLGYSIPKQYLSKLPIGSCEISFSARNLWFYAPNIPKHTNVDPVGSTFGADSNIQGIQNTIAPSTRRYGINLKFTF
jgi:TonB-linked SusC/RagA family outer membrane protein